MKESWDASRWKPLYFDGHFDQWVLTKWVRDMDHFFEWHNLSENKRVRFAKMKLNGSAQLFWDSVENLLLRKNEPPITDWEEMKLKLQEKYLPQSYRGNLLDQWNKSKARK